MDTTVHGNCCRSLPSSCGRAKDVAIDSIRKMSAGLDDEILHLKLTAGCDEVGQPLWIRDWTLAPSLRGGILCAESSPKFLVE